MSGGVESAAALKERQTACGSIIYLIIRLDRRRRRRRRRISNQNQPRADSLHTSAIGERVGVYYWEH